MHGHQQRQQQEAEIGSMLLALLRRCQAASCRREWMQKATKSDRNFLGSLQPDATLK